MTIKNSLPKLLIISGFIIIFTTLAFGIIIPRKDSEIERLHNQINDTSSQIDRNNEKLLGYNDFVTRTNALKSEVRIHLALDSLYIDVADQDYKSMIAQSIVWLKGFDRENYDDLIQLNPDELFTKLEEAKEELIDSAKSLSIEKKNLEVEQQNKKKLRDRWQYSFITLQIFGLFLGFLGGVLKRG